jgi:hypothetical protein
MADSCDKKDPLERDPVDRLFPILRKNWKHTDFQQATHDLEQLSKARYFFGQVEELENVVEIALRFKAFIETLPENEEAVKDVKALLEQVGKATK